MVAFCPHVTETQFSSAAKHYGRYRRCVLLGHPVTQGQWAEKLLRVLSLTPTNPFRPVAAGWVAEKVVRAALKPKPLVVLGGFAHRGLIAKLLMPPWFYAVSKTSRKLMDVENPPDQG